MRVIAGNEWTRTATTAARGNEWTLRRDGNEWTLRGNEWTPAAVA
ncbi:hypothetical protein [Saccharothrix syringae]|nr:hypothetical protein [Saccharothrix syringae]